MFNTVLNFVITAYYVFTEMKTPYGEKTNDAFPGFYFGVNSWIYNRVVRIVVSIFISAVCILFFIPLTDLFQIHINTFIERRQLEAEEAEYQKSLLNEKLLDEDEQINNKIEEDIWDDQKFDKDNQII